MTTMLERNSSDIAAATSPNTCSVNAVKLQFIKELQERYKDLYEAVRPVPYIKDKLYSVNEVFVEGGIEFLEGGTKRRWISLSSYKNMFDDPRIMSKMRILEGETGCGKSLITLQLAYDWCTSDPGSALKDTEILILLRLKLLGGVTSIYSGIKQTILPRDSGLSEIDVQDVLKDSNSVLIILDGFDEFPDRENDKSDVNSIIERQMLRNFEVVLTTSTFVLPNKYPPSAKRIRLTGFKDNARKSYISKAIEMDDEVVQNVEESLKEYPILNDLCQVTSRFVLFAHTKYETDHNEDLSTVTSHSSQDIMDYLHKFDGIDKLAILCILGLTEKTANIMEPIRQVCDEGVVISGHDEILLQRLYIQLLEIAATKEIPIKLVILYNCFQSADFSTSAIGITSGLTLHTMIPVKILKVDLYNREMTEDEAIAILEFASMCPSLNSLWLRGSVPPQFFKVDSTLSTLKSRNINVGWNMFGEEPDYILNLETGRWENQTSGEEPTSEEFEKMRSEFATNVGLKTEDKHKRDVKQIRDNLRKRAEESKNIKPK